MGKRILIASLIAVMLALYPPIAVPAQTVVTSGADAEALGSRASSFRKALKAKQIKLKKYSANGTVLYADTKLPAKRVKLVRKWLKQLPKKVRKRARRVYFVRKKFYLMTGSGLKNTYGYAVFPYREIWFYNGGDTDTLRDTLFHEFGHCWDWNGKKFKLSNSTAWESVMVNYFAEVNEAEEYYASVFAEYWAFLSDPDFSYIHKSLGGTPK